MDPNSEAYLSQTEARTRVREVCMEPLEQSQAGWILVGQVLLVGVAGAIYWIMPALRIWRDKLVPLTAEDAPQVRLDKFEKQHRDLEAHLRGEIDSSLSPRQQVELRLFVPQFRRQMQSRIDAVRRLSLPAPPGAVPAVPAAPSLPDLPGEADDEEF